MKRRTLLGLLPASLVALFWKPVEAHHEEEDFGVMPDIVLPRPCNLQEPRPLEELRALPDLEKNNILCGAFGHEGVYVLELNMLLGDVIDNAIAYQAKRYNVDSVERVDDYCCPQEGMQYWFHGQRADVDVWTQYGAFDHLVAWVQAGIYMDFATYKGPRITNLCYERPLIATRGGPYAYELSISIAVHEQT
jgi:hypothetical protein